MRNQILETIKTRRSVRKYKKTQIKDDELENVLVAGTYAPTARGLQAPYIVAVQKPEKTGTQGTADPDERRDHGSHEQSLL